MHPTDTYIDEASALAARTRAARVALTAADRRNKPVLLAEREHLQRALAAAEAAERAYWSDRG